MSTLAKSSYKFSVLETPEYGGSQEVFKKYYLPKTDI
jgi:hypothetical protein